MRMVWCFSFTCENVFCKVIDILLNLLKEENLYLSTCIKTTSHCCNNILEIRCDSLMFPAVYFHTKVTVLFVPKH